MKNEKIKTIPFKEYSDGTSHLIDINTCPVQIRSDYYRRNENIEKGVELCGNCDGTGNELMSMYHKCPKCEGKGVQS